MEGYVCLTADASDLHVSQIHTRLVLHDAREPRSHTLTIAKQVTEAVLLPASQQEQIPFRFELARDLLITDVDIYYTIETEVLLADGNIVWETERFPVLPPKQMLQLLLALQQLGFTRTACTFSSEIQLFSFQATEDLGHVNRFAFATVFKDNGMRLLFTIDEQHKVSHRVCYLADRWLGHIPQLIAVLRQVLDPAELEMRATVPHHNYTNWIRSGTVVGSRLATWHKDADDSVSQDLEQPAVNPITDLDDLLRNPFDEDDDED